MRGSETHRSAKEKHRADVLGLDGLGKAVMRKGEERLRIDTQRFAKEWQSDDGQRQSHS